MRQAPQITAGQRTVDPLDAIEAYAERQAQLAPELPPEALRDLFDLLGIEEEV